MASKTYCPIMTIGFNPPEEGKRDLRLCMKDCAWYDHADETCKINKICENLEYLQATLQGIGEFYDIPSEEPEELTGTPPGFDEDIRDWYSRFK